MVIRPATLQDVDGIMEYAIAGAKMYPRLKPDHDKMKLGIIDSISSARHFSWVAEENGVLHAVIIGLVGNNMWAQRQFCNIVLWASAAPGYGAKLLRELKKWVLSRRAIKVAGFAPDCELNPRIGKLMQRIGFEQYGGAYLLYN